MHLPIIDPTEAPRARAQRLVNSLAHTVLAELVLSCVLPPDAGDRVLSSAYCRRSHLRLTVSLTRYDGQTWEPVRCPVEGLTPQQRRIVGICSKDTAVSTKRIARKLGKTAVSSYLREQLRRLVDRGVLRRAGGGYVLA